MTPCRRGSAPCPISCRTTSWYVRRVCLSRERIVSCKDVACVKKMFPYRTCVISQIAKLVGCIRKGGFVLLYSNTPIIVIVFTSFPLFQIYIKLSHYGDINGINVSTQFDIFGMQIYCVRKL